MALPVAETLFPRVSKPSDPLERTLVPGISSSHGTNVSVPSFKAAFTGVSHGTCWFEKIDDFFFGCLNVFIVSVKLLETWNIWNSIFRVESDSEKCKFE